MEWYISRYNGRLPNEVLIVVINETNVSICSTCATCLKPDELLVWRSFSRRNGFGLIIQYNEAPRVLQARHMDIGIDICLKVLLASLNMVEESAIRQITHMMYVVNYFIEILVQQVIPALFGKIKIKKNLSKSTCNMSVCLHPTPV